MILGIYLITPLIRISLGYHNMTRQTAFDVFLRFMLIGSAVFFLPNQMSYGPQMMVLHYSAFAMIGLSLFVPPRRQVNNVFLALILFYGMVHTLLFGYHEYMRDALMNLFVGIVLIKVIAERVDLNRKKLGWVFIGFILANYVLLILQYFDKDPIFQMVFFENRPEIDMVGFMGIRYALASWGVLVTPFVYSVHPLACLLVLPLLYIGKSSTCVVGYWLVISFIMWIKHRKLFWIFVPITFVAGLWYILKFDMPKGQFMKRIKVWFGGIGIGRGTAWFGRGLGAWAATKFVTIQQNGLPEMWVWAHNEFLQYWYEQGVLGCLFVWAYFKNFFKHVNVTKHYLTVAGLIALSSIAMFHFPLHVARLAGISILIFAFMEASIARNEDEETLFSSTSLN